FIEGEDRNDEKACGCRTNDDEAEWTTQECDREVGGKGGDGNEQETERGAGQRQRESHNLIQPVWTVLLNFPQPVQTCLERNENARSAHQDPQERSQFNTVAKELESRFEIT